MKPIEEAAQLLIRQINLPDEMHAVWIRKELGDASVGREDRYVIMVAWHPTGFLDQLKPTLPREIMGVPVRVVPWQPDDMREHHDWHAKVAEIARA